MLSLLCMIRCRALLSISLMSPLSHDGAFMCCSCSVTPRLAKSLDSYPSFPLCLLFNSKSEVMAVGSGIGSCNVSL